MILRAPDLAGLLAATFLLAALPCAAAESPAAPREDSGPDPPGPLARSLRKLGADARYLATFPARPTPRGVRNASLVAGGVLVLVLLDEEIRREVQEARTETWDRWEERVEPLGSAKVTSAGAVLVWASGRLAGSHRVAETGRTLIETLLCTEVAKAVTKGALGREAPGSGSDDFFSGGTIFPSGHAARAFAVATVLARRHGRAAAWVAFPLATLVALARVESDVHWASDVLAGGALGWGIARGVAARRELRAARAELAPVAVRGGAGVVLRLTW